MFKRYFITFAAFMLVALALGAKKAGQIKQLASMPHGTPPSAVTTLNAKAVSWQPVLNAIGTLASVEGVTLAADAEGTVTKIAVENGAAVKAGDVLIELDTTVESAQLASAEARTAWTKIQNERASELVSKNSASQAELDAAAAQYNQAVADAAGLKAMIERRRVRAPFDGRVGIRLVNVGQYVARGRALLPLQKLDPIYVNFTVPQRQLPALTIGQKIKVKVDAFAAPFVGTLSAINPEVDAVTRNVSVQALLANPQEQLRPGMFAQVEVELPAGDPQVVVPATAIAYAPYGNSVFIVEKMKGEDGREYLGVRQQFVKLGPTRGDLIAIQDGVKAGEEVVTAGVFKLRAGMPVQINNSSQPSASAAPKPSNS